MASVAGNGRETQAVSIPSDGVVLRGRPHSSGRGTGLVLFAHGSGSSRLSSRNRMVARRLRMTAWARCCSTCSPRERRPRTRGTRVSDSISASSCCRLLGATEWIASHPRARQVKLRYFGASTGAGAALVAAAVRPGLVHVIVSRGASDLAGPYLLQVTAPTLLIVGGRETRRCSNSTTWPSIVSPADPGSWWWCPGATHLFEEPGALEQVARLAGE